MQKSQNHRFATFKVTYRKQKQFVSLICDGTLTSINVLKDANTGQWILAGRWREHNTLVQLINTRKSVRTWKSLSFLADFFNRVGIQRWEVDSQPIDLQGRKN